MSEATLPEPGSPPDALPFAAPSRRIAASAPLRWIALGWQDMKRAPRQSLTYGGYVLLASFVVSGIAWRWGSGWTLLVMLSAFIFVGPVVALGVYAVSAQLERGETPSLRRCLIYERHALGDALVYSLILMVVCLVWVRAGSAVNIFYPEDSPPPTIELVEFFAIGSAIGSIFAAVAFAASAFSLPMLVDRKADGVTAVVTSVNAVLKNRGAMIVWAMLIVAAVAIGFATVLVGLAVTMPLIGHATWHGYREVVDASAWPVRD